MKTVLEVLKGTAEYFSKHGVESARLNAELLLAQVLGKKRLDLYMEFDRPLGETELAPMREKIRKRAQGYPLQYLLGSTEFFGREFKVDERALIPRPETERFLELLFKDKPALEKERLLDVGTGTGIIALTLAAELPEAEVHALDLSVDALALAAENATSLGLGERVAFFQSDLLENARGLYGAIIANLPYVPLDDEPTLQRELQHEPRAALFSGPDGTDAILRLITQAKAHLKPGGLLALEIGLGQTEKLVAHFHQAGYHPVRIETDYNGLNRFLFSTWGTDIGTRSALPN
jgi:release factor glutamine methyltransferase